MWSAKGVLIAFMAMVLVGCSSSSERHASVTVCTWIEGQGCATVSTPIAQLTSPVGSVALKSVSDWCSLLGESLPALASPNPDGHEREVLELYIQRYRNLAEGPNSISTSVRADASAFAAVFESIKQRFLGGEALPQLLSSLYADRNSDLWIVGLRLETAKKSLCAG